MNQYIYNKVLDHDGEIEHNSGKFLKHDRIGRSSSSSSPIGNMVFGSHAWANEPNASDAADDGALVRFWDVIALMSLSYKANTHTVGPKGPTAVFLYLLGPTLILWVLLGPTAVLL